MPTAIAVTSADQVLPGGQVRVVAPPQTQSLEDALGETSAVLEQHGFLIVVYAAGAPAPVVRRLHTVRSVLESDRIVLLPIDLPPLAVAVLARQLAHLAAAFSPGVVASAARLLTHYLYAGAVLGSVSRLDRVPGTPFAQLAAHVKSWLPGGQFAVLAGPKPELVKVAEGVTLPGPTFATGLYVAQGHLVSEWIERTLVPSWQVEGVAAVPLPADSAGWWATGKVIEFAAGITDPSVLQHVVASVRRDQCPWCRLEIIGDRCVRCQTALPPPAPPSQTAAPPQTPTAPTATAAGHLKPVPPGGRG